MADLDAEYLPAVGSEGDGDQPAPSLGMEPSDELGTSAYEAPGGSEHVIGSDPEDPGWSFDSVRRWRLMAVRHLERRSCEVFAVLHDPAAAFQTSW